MYARADLETVKGKKYVKIQCPHCGKVNRYALEHFKIAYLNNGFVYCKYCNTMMKIELIGDKLSRSLRKRR